MTKSPPALAEKRRPDFFCLLAVRSYPHTPPPHQQHRKHHENKSEMLGEKY